MNPLHFSIIRVLAIGIALLISGMCLPQEPPYKDLTHESTVFGRTKTFRIYLPESYEISNSRYPVIYFFHGWGGRHFKDESARLEYELLGQLADKYRVILVMWDGNIELPEPRPYNIGNHEDVKYDIQMKDYFLELVTHLDNRFRTIPDREQRGIIGFSMGGFMSYFIAGKYPDQVGAAVNMVGSPEFFVGFPDNHTLYPLRYTFDNIKDVALSFHNMDNCPLFHMNTEVKNTAEWSNLTNFKYWQGKGNHKVDDPGETKVFEMAMRFICDRFKNPVPRNKRWSHYDLYPDFGLWDYSVKSDKEEPGFLFLRQVSPAGFGLYSYKWLPDSPPVTNCHATVTTAPIYKTGQTYDIAIYKVGSRSPALLKKKADSQGRLHISLTGDGCEVSISPASDGGSDPADFVVTGYRLNGNRKLIRMHEDNELELMLLNRGGNAYAGKEIGLTVTCADPAVRLTNTEQTIHPDKGDRLVISRPIILSCNKTPPEDASPSGLKLNVEINCGDDIHSDNITVPVFYDVPDFKHIRIDDGVEVKDKVIGRGNGNGQAEASERILMYENNRRLRLYTDDPYVESISETLYDEILPGTVWPDGFTLSSIVKIADNCPSGHIIEFLASYENKTFMPIKREVKWGKVSIPVLQAQDSNYDIVVYGGSSAGIMAAIEGARLGKSVLLLEPSGHIGGMNVEGLGGTDIDNHGNFRNSLAVKGLALEFYRRIARKYDRLDRFEKMLENGGKNASLWRFEPHVAQEVIDEWLSGSGITVHANERLAEIVDAVTKEEGCIKSILMESGRRFTGRVFIDATLEGDLLHRAGVSTVIGRESNATYGETKNGIRAVTDHAQFSVRVDPYLEEGNPASGLIATVQDEEPGEPDTGDHRIQAYCFRMCLTDTDSNRIPFSRPDEYDRADYEIYLRYLRAGGKTVHSCRAATEQEDRPRGMARPVP